MIVFNVLGGVGVYVGKTYTAEIVLNVFNGIPNVEFIYAEIKIEGVLLIEIFRYLLVQVSNIHTISYRLLHYNSLI